MKIRIAYLFLISTLFLAGCKSALVATTSQSKAEISLAETERIISELSSDKMEGREYGTDGYNRAADWVIKYLTDAGVKPFFSEHQDMLTIGGKKTANIVGLIGKRDDSKEYILLGAHLDHIGKVKSKTDSVYNGANDDASGVTAVLQIAHYLQKTKPDANVIVALFTAEESGLLGSNYLAKRMKALNIKIRYMLNFEMIGKAMTIGEDKVYITGFHRSNFASVANELLNTPFVHYLPEEICFEDLTTMRSFRLMAFLVTPYQLSTLIITTIIMVLKMK
ncbi:MAG TPA: M20/M25/M40 family metallo-hydrolase [Cyclobacteriaceae bacterium]|nr:M20/M25/M40 family metallo-hydrolase [Cyclobacteriaceae bacterium]